MPDLDTWLAQHGLEPLSEVFRAQDIDLDMVGDLTNEDMRELGLSIGQRKRLQKAIRSQSGSARADDQPAPDQMAVAEKRQITILFCDLVGSTRISQSLDPEQMFELLGLYQRNAAEVISRYGGHVAQFLGDGVFVYFGYPTAHEDDCQRAILAAFDLVTTTAALDTGLDTPLSVRIGIDTGPVVIGDLRMSKEGDIDAVAGETPNRAAKIQSLARPNEIVIGDQLRTLLGEFVTCDDLGLREVGSGLAPQHGWRVTGFNERRGKLSFNQHGVSAPLIGRADESKILDDAWADCANGKGGVVLISGEPGIGKSRLVRHLVEITPKECRRGLTFFCSSYHQGTAFHPIADQLRLIAGITYRDRADGRIEKAQELLKLAKSRGLPDRLLPLYEALIVGDNAKTLEMTPEERKARTIATLHSLVVGRARERPVMMVCEDLQWCDPSTLETMHYLIEKTADLPVLYCFSYRPEFECPWESRDNARVIKLDRFPQGAAVELIRGVASGKKLPEELEADLLDKTDGIPLFVEEITRNLLASGVLRELDDRYEQIDKTVELDIPVTLNEALMTRLDRMSDVRDVALWAAALGRRFTVDQIQAVAPFSRQELFSALGKLASSDLLSKRGPLGHEIYEFRHALVREAAYNSMLASKKRRIHKAIVEGLTDMDPDLPKRQPDLFYQHHLMAGNLPEAAEAATAAGDLIASRYKGPETRQQYQAAYDLISKFEPGPENDRLKIRAIIKLATSASKPEEIEADLERIEEARQLAEKYENLPRQVQCLYWVARLKFDQGDQRGAMEYAAKGAELAAPSGDIKMRSSPENLLAFLYSLRGYPALGIEMTERNSKDLEILGDRREATVMTGIYAFALGSGGYFERADETSERAVRMATDLGHGQSLAVATFSRATVLAWAGRMEEAKAWVERALEAADACRNPFQRFVTHGWAAEALLHAAQETGDLNPVPEALAHIDAALTIASKMRSDFHISAFQAVRAHLLLLSGDPAAAREAVESAMAQAHESEQEWGLSIGQRVLAEIALGEGAVTVDVLMGLEEGIAFQRNSGLRPELMRGLSTLARVQKLMGDAKAAKSAEDEAAKIREDLRIAFPILAAE
ncbi:MAG: AAA family ATPase [Pseudomonadota bacterium]